MELLLPGAKVRGNESSIIRIRVSSGHFCIFFSVLGLSLGAGLIIDFVSVRDGLIIAPTTPK